MSRTVLIALGGGTRSVYVASVLYTLAKKYNLTNFDPAFFISSSYITAGYFLAGQYDLMKDSWLNEAGTRKVFNVLNCLKNQPVINLEYLIEYVLKQIKPIEAEKVANHQAEVLAPLLNLKTSKWEWHSNKHPQFDYWQLLKAVLTVPAFTYSGTASYQGQDYIDGVIVDFRTLIPYLQPDDKILIIKSSPYQFENVSFLKAPLFKFARLSQKIELPSQFLDSTFFESALKESRKVLTEIKKTHTVLEIEPPHRIISLWDPRLNRFKRMWEFAENQLAQDDWHKKIIDFMSI